MVTRNSGMRHTAANMQLESGPERHIKFQTSWYGRKPTQLEENTPAILGRASRRICYQWLIWTHILPWGNHTWLSRKFIIEFHDLPPIGLECLGLPCLIPNIQWMIPYSSTNVPRKFQYIRSNFIPLWNHVFHPYDPAMNSGRIIAIHQPQNGGAIRSCAEMRSPPTHAVFICFNILVNYVNLLVTPQPI